MKPEIKTQKLLMETALSCLEGIEFAEKANDNFVKKILEEKYSNVMADLFNELATIGKVSVTIHEEIKY
jgi:hypothetical protein